ncbi:MAG TPA: hypothetical protein VN258_18230 [Mobilitalea sp.]|nr:hypothetical protein [Mobilitalea sp.]
MCEVLVNDVYINVIDQLNELGVHIIVFPELAMNKKTEKAITQYLIDKKLNGNSHIQLVFLGSLWEDRVNMCMLLSGSGTVLLKNNKKMPFEYKNPEDGLFYTESLKSRPEKYSLLDVNGLGRLLYLVCKDGLDDIAQITLWNEYGVNMEIISAFTPSILYFENQSEKFNKDYLGIDLLTNCCNPRLQICNDNSIDIGYISVPVMNVERRRVVSNRIYFSSDEKCNNCDRFCNCAHIFTLNPNKLIKDTRFHGMEVEKLDKIKRY